MSAVDRSFRSLLIIGLLSSALTFELCREETVGARPIAHEGEIRTWGTPFPIYTGIVNAHLEIGNKERVPLFELRLMGNALFSIAIISCFAYWGRKALYGVRGVKSRVGSTKV